MRGIPGLSEGMTLSTLPSSFLHELGALSASLHDPLGMSKRNGNHFPNHRTSAYKVSQDVGIVPHARVRSCAALSARLAPARRSPCTCAASAGGRGGSLCCALPAAAIAAA